MAKTLKTDRIEARFFDIDLTDAQAEERRRLSAEQVGQLELARLEEKNLFKAKKAEVEELDITRAHRTAKQRADKLELQARANAKAAREKRETQLIDCEWKLREDGTMLLIRSDNGKEVARRPATREELQERQAELDFEGGEILN